MIYLGLDPGLSGAMAVLKDNGECYVNDLPIVGKRSGKGNQLDAVALGSMVEVWAKGCRAIVEVVGPMPKQGVTSVFSFGRTAGCIDGILASFRIPTLYVRPAQWKAEFGLLKASKDRSRTVALDLFPSLAGELRLKKHDGRAEALLLAEYGRRKWVIAEF